MTADPRAIALDRALTPPMAIAGFRRIALLEYERALGEASNYLRFGIRVEGSHAHVSGTALVAFETINKLLGPGDPNDPTVLLPLHALTPSREYFEWSLPPVADTVNTADAIVDHVLKYAIPFFEKVSSIGQLRSSLESDNPEDWFVLTPEQRLMILVAIEYASGSPEAAFERLEAEIAQRRDLPPKRRRPLEAMRAHLASKGGVAG